MTRGAKRWLRHLRMRIFRRGGGGVYSFVACLSRMTIDHASLAKGGEVLCFPDFSKESTNTKVLARFRKRHAFP